MANYLGARIPVEHVLDLEGWNRYAYVYSNKNIINYVTFRFPTQHENRFIPVPVEQNHNTATAFPAHAISILKQ